MNPEQSLDAQAEGRIVGAGVIQNRQHADCLRFQGRAKESYFSIRRRVHELLNDPQ